MNYQQVKDINGAANPKVIKKIDSSGKISFIPADLNNDDWKQYQAWLAKGNSPQAPQGI